MMQFSTSDLRPMGRTGRAIASRRERPSRFLSMIAPVNGPEAPMVVEFVGLTEAEQRAALEAFPGGRRFRLAAGTSSH